MKIVLLEVGVPRACASWSEYFDGRSRFAMPSAGLVSLASLVRPQDQVSILDEKVSGPVEPLDVDLVGISFKSMYAKHAYATADRLRTRGVKVVLGGIHATLQPDQAAEHADVVVVGEGESVWPKVLDDVERGQHQPIYRAPERPPPLEQLPRQRVELVDHRHYMCHALQSARGCSFTCEFCPTRSIVGDGYRLRSVDAVVEDVVRLLAIADKPVFFTENVFGAGDFGFIEELTRRLLAIQARYAVVCDWMLMSPELAQLLARHGCCLVGINMTGRQEPAEEAALRAIYQAGIPIWGYVMFGFEEDGPEVFQGAVDKVHRYDLPSVAFTVLAPYPGTPMGERLKREGRVFDHDTDLYDQGHVLFHPRHMTSAELRQGYVYACRELHDRLGFDRAVEALMSHELPTSTQQSRT
jgi:radical SAM superfamily enzyme YgiQ (UPF0313 family)